LDEFLTDAEEADRAKQWLRENGVFVAAGIVLGLGGLFGWQQWTDYNTNVAGDASVVFEQLNAAIEGERFNEVDETLDILASDYSGTPYLAQGRLALARMHMDRNSPEEALEQLRLVSSKSKDKQVGRVAELRVAQILLYQAEYDAALVVLGDNLYPAFAGLYHELRGDIFYAQKLMSEAAAEYQLALDKDVSGGVDRAFVQVKLDDVSGSIAATTEVEAELEVDVDVEEATAEAAVSATE
jgi:predicted negative regulator of RcsB-dependent stress response